MRSNLEKTEKEPNIGVKIGGNKRDTSPQNSWTIRNDGAMLFCSPAKKRDESSLLYSNRWRAKLSQLPLGLGTVLLTMKVFSRSLPSHHTLGSFSVGGMRRTIQGVLCVVFSRSSALWNARRWTGVTSSPLSLWFECVCLTWDLHRCHMLLNLCHLWRDQVSTPVLSSLPFGLGKGHVFFS